MLLFRCLGGWCRVLVHLAYPCLFSRRWIKQVGGFQCMRSSLLCLMLAQDSQNLILLFECLGTMPVKPWFVPIYFFYRHNSMLRSSSIFVTFSRSNIAPCRCNVRTRGTLPAQIAMYRAVCPELSPTSTFTPHRKSATTAAWLAQRHLVATYMKRFPYHSSVT